LLIITIFSGLNAL